MLPPLRDIKNDIPQFFDYFLGELAKEKQQEKKQISEEAISMLKSYTWPGNMRELRNVAERALIVSRGKQIELDDMPPVLQETLTSPIPESRPLPMLKDLMEQTEKRAITQALKLTKGNKARTAKILGIHRTGLYQKMNKYAIK